MEPYELPSSSSPVTPRRHTKLYRSRSSSQSSSPPLFPSPPRASSYSVNPLQYTFISSPSLSSPPSFPAIDLDDRTHTCVSSVQKSDGAILSMAISGRLVYTGTPSNAIRVWRLPELTECGQLKTKARQVRALSVSDKYVFAAYGDTRIRVWRRSSTSMVTTHLRIATNPKLTDYLHRYLIGRDQRKHSGNVSCLDTSYSGNLLYSAIGDTTVKVWQIPDLKCIETIQAHTRAVNALVTGPDGVLYTASEDSTIRVWQWNSLDENGRHSLTLTLSAKSSPVKALSLTKDGSILYAGCTDGCIYYWLSGLGSSHLQYGGALQGHNHVVMCLASLANYVVSGSADSTCRVWVRGTDGEYNCLAVLEGHRGPIRCVVAFRNHFTREDNQDAFMVCTASMDGALKLWRITDGETVATSLPPDSGDYFKL
ncbi:protein JINGUBANG-like [Aristolochia californica]|uniref:protein JINGUBANG-like n=1 Tax=Aristolochia californica TaxID=171875 RepID=UPI0035E29EFC